MSDHKFKKGEQVFQVARNFAQAPYLFYDTVSQVREQGTRVVLGNRGQSEPAAMTFADADHLAARDAFVTACDEAEAQLLKHLERIRYQRKNCKDGTWHVGIGGMVVFRPHGLE